MKGGGREREEGEEEKGRASERARRRCRCRCCCCCSDFFFLVSKTTFSLPRLYSPPHHLTIPPEIELKFFFLLRVCARASVCAPRAAAAASSRKLIFFKNKKRRRKRSKLSFFPVFFSFES